MDVVTYAALKAEIDALGGHIDEDVAEATEAWLGEHIDPSTGYVLDSTLTLDNAAPPASAVGALKDYVDDGNMALNLSDKRNAYASSAVGETVTFSSSSATYSFVNLVAVKKDNKYKIAVQNGSTIASANKRDSVIVDSNNIVLQAIPMMVLANNTEVMEFTAVENGFLILCVDKNYVNIAVYNITPKGTFQKDVQTALLNCLRNVAWIDEQGQDYIGALENAMNYIAYGGEFGAYQFTASTYGYNGVSCGIYNGNHCKYQRAASNNAGSYVIYNPINLNSSSADSSNFSNIGTEPIFTIPANSTVVLEVKNISMSVFTGSGSSGRQKASVILRSATKGEIATPEDIVVGTNYLITSQLFENETPIYLLCGYCGGYVKTLEFDVAITVNGERWL